MLPTTDEDVFFELDLTAVDPALEDVLRGYFLSPVESPVVAIAVDAADDIVISPSEPGLKR
ncbi:hypothetical protein SCP_1502180 [Sparassis crispa]|uniref:Uncharacterized protein n=1 Tax=Sparassis crispa TaxID=139825 RepID=A0A401H4C9_9APHY|nr:hypothetical protein SCP_1502180 [Sparassis crispa]GBE89210.1 hypothetical protein SCP_1502180 [Sparassis crispa]